MIRGAFEGQMVMISGSAIAYADEKQEPNVQKLSINWRGTIVAIRIPKSSNPIDYSKYIE